MHATRGRIILPEWLDSQPPDDAANSLEDLVRINRLLGGHEVLRKALARLVNPEESFTMLDVGAASGDMGEVVRREYPASVVTSLDYRQDHLRKATGPRVTADAFRMPFAPESFDLVHCSLFLHHFQDQEIIGLLREFKALARRYVIVTDLERHPLAYYFLPATRWIFRWDPITLHDGPISVEAAFKSSELKALALSAGLHHIDVRVHRPAFRLSMVAQPQDAIVGS